MNTIEFIKAIAVDARGYTESIVAALAPGGHVVGCEYTVKNPTRSDNNAGSFKINIQSGMWSDFSAGESGGDMVSLWAYIRGLSQGKAAREIADQFGINRFDKNIEKKYVKEDLQLILPIPNDDDTPFPKERRIPGKKGEKWEKYPITHSWAYRDSAGALWGHVVRYAGKTGKETPPVTLWVDKTGTKKYKFKAMPDSRPMYNAEKLARHPHSQVVVVEGEKCAEALQELIESIGASEQLTAVTWCGGGAQINKTNFIQLTNRKIILFPDFDWQTDKKTGDVLPVLVQPGYKAMMTVAGIVKNFTDDIKIVEPDPEKPSSWDVADAIIEDNQTLPEIVAYIKPRFRDISNETRAVIIPAPHEDPPPSTIMIVGDDSPFQCLGYDRELYYYLPAGTRQITAIKNDRHGKASFRALAPLRYWERNYPGKTGADYESAIDVVMRRSEDVGVFDVTRLRGRGVWVDRENVIIHCGTHIIKNGVPEKINCDKSDKHIYEAAAEIDMDTTNPLYTTEAISLQKICDKLIWENPRSAKLLAGWCVIAPICGALKFRPHTWITGGAGTGKTYVLENIILPCLGDFSLNVASATTSAGVRQALKSDSMPVVFDEFEADDVYGQTRVQSLLELARQAFSDSGAKIIKGGQSGTATAYTIRSCFCFSSIAVNLAQHADETRISIMSLKKRDDSDEFKNKDHFADLCKTVETTLTDEYCKRLRARSISLINIIRENSEIFAGAVAEIVGTRRAGDQIGALLAGAYSLVSSNLVTHEKAMEWARTQDWTEQIELSNSADERLCLRAIMNATVKFKHGDISIAELLFKIKREKEDPIDFAVGDIDTDHPDGDNTEDGALRRCGIRFDPDVSTVYFSTQSAGISKLLVGTPWEKSFSRMLERVSGAEKVKNISFIGVKSAAISLKWELIFKGVT